MKFSLVAAGCLVLASEVCIGAQNLVTNGGFEAGSPVNSCNWLDLHAPSDGLPGWSVYLGSIDHIRATGPTCDSIDVVAFEGERFVDLDGVLQAGGIRQSIQTVANARYLLEFKMSGTNYCGALLKRLEINIGGQTRTFSYVSVSSGQQNWVSHSMEFTATSAAELLTIHSLDGSGCGPKIDDVRISELIPCSADVVQNGVVDGADLAAVLTVWGTTGGIYPRADINGDGTVDGSDLAAVLGSWGSCL